MKGHILVYYISYTVGDKKLYSDKKEKSTLFVTMGSFCWILHSYVFL